MPGREVALACVLLLAAGDAAAGRVQPGKDAWKNCKEQISTHQPEGLPAVDWCNRDYAGEMVSLKRGRGEMREYRRMGGPHDTHISTLESISYLDVDGDGRKEALVFLHRVDWIVDDQGDSRSHERTTIFAYRWKENQPVLIGTMDALVPVFAVAAHRGKVAVRSGPTPHGDDALSRYRLTPDGFEPQSAP